MNSYPSGTRKAGDVQIAVFQYLVAITFLWLLSGFWQLQVQSPQIYSERAERNRIKSLPLLAPRGKILDRDGRVIVDNSPSHKVLLSRALLNPKHLQVIADGLNIPLERLTSKLKRLEASNAPEYQAAILKENLTQPEVAFVEAHRSQFPELELIRSQRRLYPRGGLAAHAIGYVGEISDAELELDDFMFYEPGAEIGKAGMERQYNDVLTGTDGSRLVEVDSLGRERKIFGKVDAKAGHSLRLTLDLDLQVVAELALEGKKGAVVALDPRNGEVLALASRPTYDPNQFVGGISSEDWRGIDRDPEHPMLNRAIQAQLAPGSIFKPVVALAASESGVLDEEFAVTCSGGASFYTRYFRCHKAGGHGSMDLRDALKQSCNVYFYNLGNKLGIDRIAEYAELAGLGRRTGIDLPHEAEGLVPSTKWKLRMFREKWYLGETISVSIGQGALTVTPLQAAYALGGIAMEGVWHRPHLVSYDDLAELRPEFARPDPIEIDLNKGHLETIRQGLWAVVNDGGTGGRARIDGYDVCGKTGTAQLASTQYKQGSDDPRMKDTAWFVAFAPCKAPEIVVAALVETGEHGHLAAPTVRDVVKSHIDKEARVRWARRAAPPAEAPDPAAPAAQTAAVLEGRMR
ncbi:MAG TPA: penicillin-binding protein 2 [Bryobacterales bacterium]|nr:penicillin-binding protein 2 [Bryobacterales bacterium]